MKKQYRARSSSNKKSEEDAHATICRCIALQYPDVIFTSDASGLRLTMGLRKRFSRLKSETGIPDLLILEPRGGYCGLLLEIKKSDDDTVFSKVDGKLLNSKHIREQAAILDRLKHKGYATYFAIGSKQGIEIVDEYMKGEIIQMKDNKKKIIEDAFKAGENLMAEAWHIHENCIGKKCSCKGERLKYKNVDEYIKEERMNISPSLPDAENIEYLRGFVAGYGGDEPHEVFPDGFNNINEIWNKISELESV